MNQNKKLFTILLFFILFFSIIAFSIMISTYHPPKKGNLTLPENIFTENNTTELLNSKNVSKEISNPIPTTTPIQATNELILPKISSTSPATTANESQNSLKILTTLTNNSGELISDATCTIAKMLISEVDERTNSISFDKVFLFSTKTDKNGQCLFYNLSNREFYEVRALYNGTGTFWDTYFHRPTNNFASNTLKMYK